MAEAPKPAGTSPRVDFVVEIGDSQNRNVIWPLDSRLLRGKWTKANLPAVVIGEKFANMPDLPGMCLSLDSNRRKAHIFDPLADPRNEALLKKAQAVVAATFGPQGPEEKVSFENLDDDAIKSWCYWVRRFVDAGIARVVKGAVPEMSDVFAMPGRYATNNHDQGVNAEKSKERPDRPYKPLVRTAEDAREYEVVI